jgi:hypothetical protein
MDLLQYRSGYRGGGEAMLDFVQEKAQIYGFRARKGTRINKVSAKIQYSS